MKIIKKVYAILSIIFVMPSLIYLIQNKTIYQFNQWFKFFLNDTKIELQTLIYIVILIAITFFYIMIIKNRKILFKNIKSILIYVAIISSIYIIAIPFTCSDVFYYMGVGRLDCKYGQNPYYTTIKQYVNENAENKGDTVLKQGYENDWSDTTVVYGPVWQIVCKTVAFLSLGNVDIGILIFKILNLIIHLVNCWLIYKITGKKIFTIMYGLNPFVLIEGIMCVHNDIFVVLFTLISLYFIKKKKLVLSVISLAFATAIKYFSIILLPFMIIYYFRKENVGKRMLNCIKYGTIFAITLILPYLIYMKDLSIFSGMATQQGKVAKSLYLIIIEYFPNLSVDLISKLLLGIFVIIYFFTVFIILFKEKIKFQEIIRKYTILLVIFIFALITQFQPWYLMWLMPIFMWQKSKNVKNIIAIGVIAEFANSVFLLNGEGYIYGIPFILIMYILILIYNLTNEFRRKQIGQASINRWK